MPDTADPSDEGRDLHPHEHPLPPDTGQEEDGAGSVSDAGGDSDPGASTAD